TFWSRPPASSERTFDLSTSKQMIAVSVLRTSSDERERAASESASRCRRTRSASSWAARFAASIESRIRWFCAAVSTAGAGGGGAGLPPQDAPATIAAPKPSARSNDTDFILSLRSGGGRRSLRKPWRPGRQTGPALLQQRPDSAGLEIDDP